MTGFQSVTAVTISGAFVFGMLLVLLESLRAVLAKRFDLGGSRIDWLLSALNISLIPMMLLSGILSDKLGVQLIFLAGSAITTVAVFSLALSTTVLRALGAILLAGAGGACLSTASSVLMSKAFFPENEPASQNLGNVFFALGALVTPAIVAALLQRFDCRRALGVVALVCLVPAFLAAVTESQAFRLAGNPAELDTVLRSPTLWLAGLALLLYAPLEGSLGTWARQYLTDRGFPERRAAWLLSGFWLTFLAARLLAALLQERSAFFTGAWLMVVLALAAAVFLGNMVGARTRSGGAIGLLLVGACFGPIFPTLVGKLFERFPHERGTAFGTMFAIGALGNLILPPVIGAYARRTTVQRAMAIPMVMALLLALVILVYGLCLPLL